MKGMEEEKRKVEKEGKEKERGWLVTILALPGFGSRFLL